SACQVVSLSACQLVSLSGTDYNSTRPLPLSLFSILSLSLSLATCHIFNLQSAIRNPNNSFSTPLS
ncbi:MAG: hypothetical protein ACK2U0_20590, partial [Candidatus Promineifilaceae bacterium]